MPRLGAKKARPSAEQRRRAEIEAWHNSPAGCAAYQKALHAAQADADRLKMDHALEFNSLFKYWTHRMLPQKHFRFGADHTCQVVYPTSDALPGHGPQATRPPSPTGPDYHGGPWCGREKALEEIAAWEARTGFSTKP
jgi:hypothetical protein